MPGVRVEWASTCNPRFWSSHYSFASGCVWLDLAAFREKNTGTFCV